MDAIDSHRSMLRALAMIIRYDGIRYNSPKYEEVASEIYAVADMNIPCYGCLLKVYKKAQSLKFPSYTLKDFGIEKDGPYAKDAEKAVGTHTLRQFGHMLENTKHLQET